MIENFLHSQSVWMRFARTVAQGLLSVLIVAVPLASGGIISDPTTASLVTAAIMAVLSPLMAMIKTGNPEDGLSTIGDDQE